MAIVHVHKVANAYTLYIVLTEQCENTCLYIFAWSQYVYCGGIFKAFIDSLLGLVSQSLIVYPYFNDWATLSFTRSPTPGQNMSCASFLFNYLLWMIFSFDFFGEVTVIPRHSILFFSMWWPWPLLLIVPEQTGSCQALLSVFIFPEC